MYAYIHDKNEEYMDFVHHLQIMEFKKQNGEKVISNSI